MSILSPLVASNPSTPRLTVYDEAAGTRMEFSAVTLDNWASKIANMLDEEFEATSDAKIVIDLPVSWQAAVIAIGVVNSSRTPLLDTAVPNPAIVFTTLDNAARWSGLPEVPDVVVVSSDPFGRGVVESGDELPAGTVDFGPTVRFYGDDYFGATPELDRWSNPELGASRYLIDPWNTTEDIEERLLAPLAAHGSVVVTAGLVSADRLEEIIDTENVSHFLTA